MIDAEARAWERIHPIVFEQAANDEPKQEVGKVARPHRMGMKAQRHPGCIPCAGRLEPAAPACRKGCAMLSRALVLLLVAWATSRAETAADPAALMPPGFDALVSPIARRPPRSSSDWVALPCRPFAHTVAQHGNQNPGSWPAPENRDGPPHSAHFGALDLEAATISGVGQSLSRQTGFKIALYPQNLPRWKNQRVTLHHSQGLSFWKAVDEVCDAASLQYNPSMQGYAGQQDQAFAP